MYRQALTLRKALCWHSARKRYLGSTSPGEKFARALRKCVPHVQNTEKTVIYTRRKVCKPYSPAGINA